MEVDRRGLEEEKPEITLLKLLIPMRGVLQELRAWNDNDARFISFALLGLSVDGTRRLARALKIRGDPLPPGRFRRVSFVDHGTMVVVMHTPHADTEEFKRKVLDCMT